MAGQVLDRDDEPIASYYCTAANIDFAAHFNKEDKTSILLKKKQPQNSNPALTKSQLTLMRFLNPKQKHCRSTMMLHIPQTTPRVNI